MKIQIQNRIVELLIPTLNKIISNQGTYFVAVMNNRLKIISEHGAPLSSMERFFPKKASDMEETINFWGEKIMDRLSFLIGGLIIGSCQSLGGVS